MTLLVAGAALLTATGVFAMKGMGGMNCGMMANVKPDEARAFFKETSDLRTEVMVKQIELRQERAKSTPDTAKVEALQKELTDLRAKLQAAAKQHNMPECGCMAGGMMQGGMANGGCGKMGQKGAMGKDGCGKMGGKGGCGSMGGGMGMANCGKMGAGAAPAAGQN
jgi:zinc resistance-associated protein